MFEQNTTKRWLTGGLVIAAVSFPSAAQARPELGPPLPGRANVQAPAISQPAAPQTRPGSDSGFRWGDAGIGAAGTAVLLSVGAVGSVAARRRRTHRTVVG
jgi:hypothetical protein